MPRNENPLEKQLLHLDLSKGCNERDRPETADPTTTLTRLDNLTQDQSGAYIKRPGTPFLGGTSNDDSGTLLVPAKLIRTRESLAAIDQTGKYFQYQEALGKFRQRGQVPDFTVKSDLVVGSGPVVTPAVYSSSTTSRFHVLVHSAGVDTGAGNPSLYLTVYDRNSGSIVAQYDLRSVGGVTGTVAAAQAVIVDDRYVHCFVGTSFARVVFVLDTQSSLPANEAAITTTSVSASPGGITDVSYGSGRSYVMFSTPSGATSIASVTNGLSVTTASGVIPNTQAGLQISYSGTKLWFMGSLGLGALDPTTMAVSVALTAHGGPTNGYMAVDSSDVVWCANEASTAMGGTTLTTVQFRKTPSANSTTFNAVHASLDAWKIAGTPFVIQSSKVYVHLLKESTFTVTPHAVVPMDPSVMATPTYRGVAYNSVRIAASPESHIGVANAYVLRILAEAGMSGTKAGLMIAIQTTARASGYCVYELSVISKADLFAQNFGGLTYLSGGCHVACDGGDQPVEVGFVDLPRVDAASGAAGVINGAVKYLAVYRYINSAGAVSWSRVSPITSITVANKQVTVNVSAPSVTLHDRELGTTAVSPRVSVELYRTISGGTNYYLAASSQTGTPASGLATQLMSLGGGTRAYLVTDNISDATLASQPLLFRQPGTSNSALDRYPPPAGNVLCQHKDRLFTSDPNGLRVYYSSFFVDGETAWFNPLFSFLVHGGSGPITGIISMDGRLFVFKRDGIFVVDGDGPAEGGVAGNEFSPPQRLATEYGCVDQRSLCVTTEGVVYRSSRGIEILTRSLQVKWLGDRVQNTVDANPKTCGAVLDTSGQVRIALSSAETSTGLQTVSGAEVVYDFTTDSWNVYTHTSGTGVTSASVQDICMANINGTETVCIADPYGGVCGSSLATGLDRGTYYVGWTLETAWIRTGQQARQRISKALLLAKKRASSNHKITISVAYNYLDGYGEPILFEPTTINDGTVEELEKQLTSPQALAVRLLIQEAAPTDTVTYPVGLGLGCDLLGVTFQIAPKDGEPKLSSARKGSPPTVTPIITEAGDGIVMESGDPIVMEG